MSERHAEVLIIGAGPAGLAAAATCLAGGLSVVLVDNGAGPGGQFWRQRADGQHRNLSAYRRLHHDLDTFTALSTRLDEAVAVGRATTWYRHEVWSLTPTTDGWQAAAVAGGREVLLTGQVAVLATGAHEITLPFPGWDLPGCFTAGGLQALLKGSEVLAGQRVLLAGTGPFLLPVATGLARYGATVVGIADANAPVAWVEHSRTVAGVPGKVWEGMQYAARLARHRIPLWSRTIVTAAQGVDRVESVRLATVDGVGRVVPGTDRTVDVDAIGVGFGFAPTVDLAVTAGAATARGAGGHPIVTVDADQRSSVPGLYVAGEPTGVGGADLALREGEMAGHAIVAALGRAPVSSLLRRQRIVAEADRFRAFATAMSRAHPVPSGWTAALAPETVICRCEEVPYAAVQAAIDAGARDPRQVKSLTRAGMGWCQGRICEPACRLLTPEAGEVTERLVTVPVPLGSLARE